MTSRCSSSTDSDCWPCTQSSGSRAASRSTRKAFRASRPILAFNTASSFATNTNWQLYGGETTMSYLTQMTALTVQNFVSAATGMAVLIAFIRGLRARSSNDARQLLGGPHPGNAVHPVAAGDRPGPLPGRRKEHSEPLPRISRSLGRSRAVSSSSRWVPRPRRSRSSSSGTNGGGFFNVNSSHPFENPTALSNFGGSPRDPAHLRVPSVTPSARWSATPGRAGRCSPP